MKYYKIEDRFDSCFEAHVPKCTNIQRPGACKQCGTLPVGKGPPQDLVVKDDYPVDVAISFSSWGYGVINCDFLADLGHEAALCLQLGQIQTDKGSTISNFRTFVGKESVFLRGNYDSTHYLCKACYSIVYNALPRSERYLTRAMLKSQRLIYEVRIMGLLISESILSRIVDKWGHMVMATDIPVIENPKDGLPADIALFLNTDQVGNYQPNPPSWMSGN